jgi:hypothetical protein
MMAAGQLRVSEVHVVSSSLSRVVLKHIGSATVALLLTTCSLHARQMECSYDFITHQTIMQLRDDVSLDGSIDAVIIHEVSPVGGEDLYILDSDPTQSQILNGYLRFVANNLFYLDDGLVDAIAFVDFEKATLKELQFPASKLQKADPEIQTSIVNWLCHRTD